jgi:hypothetical protein
MMDDDYENDECTGDSCGGVANGDIDELSCFWV